MSSTPSSLSVGDNYEIVVRSIVVSGLKYADYREDLRSDFFYSCAYCTLSEFEAQGIRFTIDHYEPQSDRPDLVDDYHNLLYCCDTCNLKKNDLIPSEKAKKNGLRYFRPDSDIRSHHFNLSGVRLNELTPVGFFSIQALDLNRQALLRLREIRKRFYECNEAVATGIMALRSFHLDQLPQTVRGSAHKAITMVAGVANDLQESIDTVLRAAARSPLIDLDEEKTERLAQRAATISTWQGLYPGVWRGRNRKTKPKAKPGKGKGR